MLWCKVKISNVEKSIENLRVLFNLFLSGRVDVVVAGMVYGWGYMVLV